MQQTETNYIDDETGSVSIVNNSLSAAKCYIRIKGNPLVAVLDSGAATSIITKKLLNKLGLTI